jgi:hypothetical protein
MHDCTGERMTAMVNACEGIAMHCSASALCSYMLLCYRSASICEFSTETL